MSERLFRNTAILYVVIGIMNFIGNKIFLYWTTWWYDMILHFLAGFVIGMTAILFLQTFSRAFQINNRKVILASVLFTLAIGLLWEYFELYFEITSFTDGITFWTDTSSDIILDTLGGLLGTFYSFRVLKRNG